MRSDRRIGIKCYKDDIFLIIAFYLSLFYFIAIPFASTIRNMLVAILLIYVLQNIKRVFKGGNKTIFFLVLAYATWMVIDSFFYNEYIQLAPVNSLLNSVIKGLIVIEGIFTVDIYCKKRGFSRLLGVLFVFVGIMFVLSNAYVIIRGFNTTEGDYYLVGTKFSTSYLNILFIVLIFFRCCYNKKRVGYVGIGILYVFSFFIAIKTDCSSALVALLLSLVFLIFKRQLQQVFSNRMFLLASFVVIFLFVYFYNLVLQNVYVTHVVINVLGETLTMNGRTFIYRRLPEMLSDIWFTGFGSGRTGMIINYYTGCNDAQNAVWQIICENGFIGFILYALTSLKLRNSGGKDQISNSYYLNVYFALMLILGLVEITFDARFLVLLFIVYLYNESSKTSSENVGLEYS
ncbi:MAG: hypothetical protein U0M70_03095 [Eubacteriales bacterium]